jgi:predicted aldo/keto reductase-like oxidoreductase
MQYRTIPRTGEKLSILGFGCMRLPEKNGTIDEERAAQLIRRAVDEGVNYIDTAFSYHRGRSEPFLARALSDGYRSRVRLATKLPHWLAQSREDLDRLLAAQLERLDTRTIDYYLIHSLEATGWERMNSLGVVSFLERAKSDGRILHTGFSFHGDRPTFKTIIDAYDWDCCLIQYNYLDQENQAGTEGLEYAASRGVGLMIMEPLRGGYLARKPGPRIQHIWDEASVQRSPAEWALRWVWNRPEVVVVLSGMSDQRQLEENLRIADAAGPGSLTGEELRLVRRVTEVHQELVKVNCTGCRYCMPCPAGVDIATCFEAYNNLHGLTSKAYATMFYLIRVAGVGGRPASYASLCTECGACQGLCPQHLPIPKLLKKVARELEGPRFRIARWLASLYLRLQRRAALRAAKRARRRDPSDN